MSAAELRKKYHDTYKLILCRNVYNQNLRQYVYTPNKDKKYYSDCSSSQCATFNKIGIKMGLMNTAGIYNSDLFEKVNVTIKNGHVTNVSKLRVGDLLMFRGTDPSRPLQIGHVEGVYEINGTTEDKIVLCGHGSGTPSTKNMKTYCTSREASKAPNGKTKGLVCVLRCIKDDNKNTYKIVNCKELNVREKPNSEKTTKIIRTLKAGDVVEIEKITTNKSGSKWGKIKGKKEYISMKYTEKA